MPLGNRTTVVAFALLLAACEQPLSTSPRPAAAPRAEIGADAAVASATLDQLLATERSPASGNLLPGKLALTARLAALISAPPGSPDARTLDELLARLRALEAAKPLPGQR